MKKARLIIGMCLVLGISMLWITPVFATDLSKTPVTTVPNKPMISKTLERESKTTDTAIKFAEDEYLRITTPNGKDEIKTFEKQLNVMGEARANTKVTMTVYYENPEQRIIAGKPLSRTYEVSDVGATQTFNQLIDLEVGENKIIVKYVYDKKSGSYELEITRQSEAEKEQIKNYIANTAEAFSITKP